MHIEYRIDLCFIRATAEGDPFVEDVESELESLFDGMAYWYLESKHEQEADIVLAEIKGKDGFLSEEQALTFMEDRGTERFWDWLQGYKIIVEEAGGCAHCQG